MPRYIVHVGPMKTGSTYVQKCLTGAAAELLKQGVCYPLELLAENNKHMHMPVFSAVKRGDGEALRPVFEKLNAAGHETIVLSCEHLSKLGRVPLERLRVLIGVADIEIVYAVRRWSDRIPSMWFQSLFTGAADTLPEFYVKLLNSMTRNADIDYTVGWRKISDVFGRGNLSLFPYSTIMDRREDIFARFCTDVLKLKTVPTPETFGTKAWASFSMEDTEILRVLNGLFLAEHGTRDTKMYWGLNRGRDKLDNSAIKQAMQSSLTTMVLDETARHFDRSFRRMEEFADRVIGGGPVFDRRKVEETYVTPGYLLKDGIAAALRGIYAKYNVAPAQGPSIAELDEDEYEEDTA